ncbi:MAG: DUF1330 domain-containing protein [Novosphingobium sp.]
MIFIREGAVTDPEAMARYQTGNRGGGGKPTGMKPLVVYGKMEALEGEAPDGIVVLEFPDSQSARDWYYSEDYQSRVPFRQQAAPYRAVMVEGI